MDEHLDEEGNLFAHFDMDGNEISEEEAELMDMGYGDADPPEYDTEDIQTELLEIATQLLHIAKRLREME